MKRPAPLIPAVFLGALIAILLLPSARAAAPATSGWNIVDHLPFERIVIQGHRGVGQELRAHSVVFQAFPYTEDPTAYGKLLDLGVMSFATDHPDVTLREVKVYYAARKKK